MRLIFFLLTLSISLQSYAQHDEAYVNELTGNLVQKLSDSGVENYFVANRYCAGSMRMILLGDKMCASKGTYYEVYLIYEQEGNGYIQKVDNCGIFEKLMLPNTQIPQFVNREWPALKDDIVKPYHSESYTGIPELRKTPESCFRRFTFYKGSKSFEKTFNVYDISNGSEGLNKNYTFNQTLKLVQLNTMIDEVLPPLSFKRI
jgi:hypothetical protein